MCSFYLKEIVFSLFIEQHQKEYYKAKLLMTYTQKLLSILVSIETVHTHLPLPSLQHKKKDVTYFIFKLRNSRLLLRLQISPTKEVFFAVSIQFTNLSCKLLCIFLHPIIRVFFF